MEAWGNGVGGTPSIGVSVRFTYTVLGLVPAFRQLGWVPVVR